MSGTLIVAWVGAITGVASLGWNIYVKFSSGPKLVVDAAGNTIKTPPSPMPGQRYYIRASVQNVGTQPTTVTDYTLHGYKSLWEKVRKKPSFNAVVANYEGKQLPYKLDVGEYAQMVLNQADKLDELVNNGGLWFAVTHSFSRDALMVRVVAVPRD